MDAKSLIQVPWEEAFRSGLTPEFDLLLKTWLPSRRWFLAKGAKNLHLRLEDMTTCSVKGRTVHWLLLEVLLDEGSRQFYQLPLVLLDDIHGVSPDGHVHQHSDGLKSRHLVDAWSWPPFADVVLDSLANAGPPRPASPVAFWRDGEISARPAGGATFPSEQSSSNWLVRYGDAYLLKVLRFLPSGTHPEEEMCRFLTGAGFPYVIPVLGGMTWRGVGAESRCLALLAPYLANEGNAWDWFRTQLLEQGRTGAALSDEAERLGDRTALLHLVLGRAQGDDAFTPEPFTNLDYDLLQARVRERLRQVCDQLLPMGFSSEEERGQVRFIVENAGVLLSTVVDCPVTGPLGKKTRIHGDYHLGQVLRHAEGDWVIFDFEGEPLRPLSERRMKDSPLRDVAGMRRSFAYASALSPAHTDRIRDLKEAFTEGYFRRVVSDGTLLPRQPRDREAVLRLYEIEKLLYEIEYELCSRPEWLHVPLGDLYRLVSGVVGSGGGGGSSKVG